MPGSYKGYAQKHDDNHSDIVSDLRKAGAETFDTNSKDIADIVVSTPDGNTLLLEIKTADGKLEPGQVEWLWNWNGRAMVVRSSCEALDAIGDESQSFPLTASIPVSLRNACKMIAMLLGVPRMVIIRTYVLAKAEFERTKVTNQKFKHTLEAEDHIAMSSLPRLFGYPDEFFWEFFIERINAGKLLIVPLNQGEAEMLQGNVTVVFESINFLLEVVEQLKIKEAEILKFYEQMKIYSGIPNE